MKVNFENYLKENADLINEELDLILMEFLAETKKTNIKLTPFALGLLNSSKGGKRIRGVLVRLGYELANGSRFKTGTADILKISAAYEILHTGFLIHDDIFDKSLKRRGQPSLYKSLGVAQAITIGSIALYLPVKLITNSSFLGEYKLKALEVLSQIVINTGWGQILDVDPSASSGQEEKEFVNLYKTAKYTVVGPLQIGAILAGAELDLLDKLDKFGENLGIAFQIQDDILDSEVEDLEKAKSEISEHVTKAKKLIPEIVKDPILSNLLILLSEYMVERKK